MSNLDIIRGRQVVVPLTNRSGGSVAAGDVVVVGDGTNDKCFTTTTTASFNSRSVGIAQETIANGSEGRVLLMGYSPIVNSAASLTRDHFLYTSTTAKEATGSATRTAGAFGQVLETATDPEAIIWGLPELTDDTGAGGGFVGARATHSTTQTISNATFTALNLNTTAFESESGWHDTVTNNTRMTVPSGQDGKYLVAAGVTFAADADGTRQLRIRKNGATYLPGFQSVRGITGEQMGLSLAIVTTLVATDYVEAVVYSTAGNNLDTVSATDAQTNLSVALLGT